jgi:hypothetical protein
MLYLPIFGDFNDLAVDRGNNKMAIGKDSQVD